MFIYKAKRMLLTVLIVGMLLIGNCGSVIALFYSIGRGDAEGGGDLTLLGIIAAFLLCYVGNEVAGWAMAKDSALNPGNPQKELVP